MPPTKLPSLPPTIRINGKTWRLRYGDLEGLAGLCEGKARIITVSPHQSHEELDDSLLHELLHACAHDTPALFGDHEELAVEVLTPKLLGALKSLGVWRSLK